MERPEPGVEVFECRHAARSPTALEERLKHYRCQMMISIDKVRLMHRRDFYAGLHLSIENNFKSSRKQHFRTFVYFLVFKIENVDEIPGLNLFESLDAGESPCRRIELPRLGSAEEYFHALLAEEEADPQRGGKNLLVVFFRERAELPGEQLEALVKTASERLLRNSPRLKIALVFSVLQNHSYTLCSKAVHVEELPFSAGKRLVFETLLQFAKHSHLPNPVLGPRCLDALIKALEEYCVSVESSIRQWLSIGELTLMAVEQRMPDIAAKYKADAEAHRFTARYKLGMRVLRKSFKALYPHDGLNEELWLASFVTDFTLSPGHFVAKTLDEGSFHAAIRTYLGHEKFKAALADDERLRGLVEQYATAAAQPRRDNASVINDMITTKRRSAASTAGRSATTALQVYNSLVKLCFYEYFRFVEQHYRVLLVNDTDIVETHLNPDLRGALYLALGAPPGEALLERLASAFFEVVCEAPMRGSASQLFHTFRERVTEWKLDPQKTPWEGTDRRLENVFLYQICVFEHLGLLRVNRRRCSFEKFVFKKVS